MAGQGNRKWIAERMSALDAERDYAEIVRLSLVYGVNDFQMHWVYAVNTPAAGIAPRVFDAVYRGGAGTYGAKPERRVADSGDHLITWFEHGPESAVTQTSVDMVNRYHQHFAREHPDGFAHLDDYRYILCLNATAVNSSITSLGLPGFDAKQKKALHVFWSRLAEQFTFVPDGTPVTDHFAFPDSYEGMEQVVEEYLARDWPQHRPSQEATEGAIEHFATTWFPRPMRPVGRALVTGFMHPVILRTHAVRRAPRSLEKVARGVMKTMVLLSTRVLPDPKVSFADARRTSGAEASPVDDAVHRAAARTAGAGLGCPHLERKLAAETV